MFRINLRVHVTYDNESISSWMIETFVLKADSSFCIPLEENSLLEISKEVILVLCKTMFSMLQHS